MSPSRSSKRPRRTSSRPRSSTRSRTRTTTSTPRSRHHLRNSVLTLVVLVVLAAIAWYGGDWLDDLDSSTPGASDQGSAGAGGGGRSDVEQARRQLSELEVAEWSSMRGYSRDRFSHWRSEDGCNVRHLVLARDGEDVTVDDRCRAVAGTWFSPYDGLTLTDPSEVDIDHMVPLANAWRTGAAEWDEQRRVDFANDLDTPQLIAVSATSNRAKGDQDPSQWKPPERGYWCQYAQDWVAVKHHWELSVTSEEKAALEDMLDTCR